MQLYQHFKSTVELDHFCLQLLLDIISLQDNRSILTETLICQPRVLFRTNTTQKRFYTNLTWYYYFLYSAKTIYIYCLRTLNFPLWLIENNLLFVLFVWFVLIDFRTWMNQLTLGQVLWLAVPLTNGTIPRTYQVRKQKKSVQILGKF